MKKLSSESVAKLKEVFETKEFKSLIESTEKATDTDTGTFEVVITTENIDRYEELILMDGWEVTHYLNNPVVLWGHDHSKLIAVTTSLEIVDGKMIAKGKFAPTEEGQEKRKLYEQGFLKATSVGFIAKEREGNLITKAELLEWSFVAVGANPYALRLAMEKELNVNELVTKGILFIEKEVDSPEPTDTEPIEEEQPTDEPKETPTEEPAPEPTEDQKALADLIAKQVITAIKDGALEATPSEPERTDDEPVDDEDDPEVKNYELRKQIQQADTILGEVLAEFRQKNTRRS